MYHYTSTAYLWPVVDLEVSRVRQRSVVLLVRLRRHCRQACAPEPAAILPRASSPARLAVGKVHTIFLFLHGSLRSRSSDGLEGMGTEWIVVVSWPGEKARETRTSARPPLIYVLRCKVDWGRGTSIWGGSSGRP